MIRPDLTLSGRPTPSNPQPAEFDAIHDYVAVAEVVEVPEREGYLVIREMPSRKVVTVIEVLSPTNKAPGAQGRGEYLKKRTEVLATETSLVEIDLLRTGLRPPFRGELPPHQYLVLVHRGWERPKVWARGWRLADPIPAVPIPLRADESAVTLDLARAVALVYERGAYDAVLDYDGPAQPALDAGDAGWAKERVIAARQGRGEAMGE